MSDKQQLSLDYLGRIRVANTETAKKELFLQLFTRLFSGDVSAQELIADISAGAEKWIANINRKGRVSGGRADTFSETIIIEWEASLARTGDHAVDQLKEYLQGSWSSGDRYKYELLATDGEFWRRYAPDWSEIERSFDLDADFTLRQVSEFHLNEQTASEFYLFLDELFFGVGNKAPTLKRISNDFGDTSTVFINAITAFRTLKGELSSASQLSVAYDQWKRFLSVAYGQFDDAPNMFFVHSYLSVVSKLIAFSVLNPTQTIDSSTIVSVLKGGAFERHCVEGFVDDDFFWWITDEKYYPQLETALLGLAALCRTYDFSKASEDILKGVYQELIDLETRHALGEYYTPDWLCEFTVSKLVLHSKATVLDPGCGSGSFLRAAIKQLRSEFPDLTAAELVEQVVGIDIHPLSVQISKATMLIALSDLIQLEKKPIQIKVYLANSLLVPQGSADLLGQNLKITVDNKNISLNLSSLNKITDFDDTIGLCDDIAAKFKKQLPYGDFINVASKNLDLGEIDDEIGSQIYELYNSLREAKNAGRDSIWKFIIQNSYKPIFLQKHFDYVIGNPPWLTYGDVSNADYQNVLRKLSDTYSVTPKRKNMPHLEIAAIFLAHAVNYFLRETGKVVFVLPRSFLSANQHEKFIEGEIASLSIESIWDFVGVTPLFRVPSCLVIGRMAPKNKRRGAGSPSIPGLKLSGRPPEQPVAGDELEEYLSIEQCTWHYSALGAGSKKKSALTLEDYSFLAGKNAYRDGFKEGATILPRNFFFIELEQDIADVADLASRTARFVTDRSTDAKPPWKDFRGEGFVNGDFLFRTAISRCVIPHLIIDPCLVFVPCRRQILNDTSSEFVVLNSRELLSEGFGEASDWLNKAEQFYEDNQTENSRRAGMDLSGRLNYHGLLQNQKFHPGDFLVLYTSSASDACAAVISPNQFDLPFIVDHKTYWMAFQSEQEAHYVCGFLNSSFTNGLISEFQSRGLLGPRDIHTLILQVPLAKFSSKDERHLRIAEASKELAKKITDVPHLYSEASSSPNALGRTRSTIRRVFTQDFDEIAALIESVIMKHANAAKAPNRTNRRSSDNTKRSLI